MEDPDLENSKLNIQKCKEYDHYKCTLMSLNTKLFNNTPGIFIRPSGNQKALSEFEKILISEDDKSAIISLVLRHYQNESFLKKTIDLKMVMQHYADNENFCVANFLSILMFDWHDQNEGSKYFLIEKLKIFKEISSRKGSLLEKLFKILDKSSLSIYHYTCLKIIYSIFDEVQKNLNEELLESLEIHNLIEKALTLRNEENKITVLKVLVMYMPNQNFKNIKNFVLKAVECDYPKFTSACKVSYKSLSKYCNFQFFKLLFLLKENLVTKFKVNFNEFMKTHKKFYGDFWLNAMKLNAQILYRTAENQNLRDTAEFLLLLTQDLELKQPIISTFRKTDEFYIVFNEPLEKEDENYMELLTDFVENELVNVYDNYEVYFDLKGFEKLFKNTTRTRKLLFGRKELSSRSLFETILIKNNSNAYEVTNNDYVLSYIWNEFRLWDVPEIFIMKNPLQKTLLDYILETENDRHLISFLMTIPSEYSNTTQKPKHHMMLKNSLYYDHKKDKNDKCLIEFHLKVIDKNKGDDPYNLDNLFYLFEEIGIYSSEQKSKNEFIREIINRVMAEKSEKFNGKDELTLPRKHFLVGILMIYWSHEIKSSEQVNEPTSHNETFSKPYIEQGFLFFRLLYLIMNKIDKDQESNVKFHKEFPEEMEKIEKSFPDVYALESTYDNKHQQQCTENIFHFYEKYSTNFTFVLLYAAIKTNQKDIIDNIFKFNNFLITDPTFPVNMEPSEVHYHTMLKFLENKYELGRDSLPRNWITQDAMKEFLDSRITSYGGFYRVNCRFMLPYYNHDMNIKSPNEIDDDLIMNEDYDTLEFIINDYELRSLVTHPVLEMIIEVKSRKYSDILTWNLFAFISLYIMPTIGLAYLYHSVDFMEGYINPMSENSNIENMINSLGRLMDTTSNSLNYHAIAILSNIRLPFPIIKEYFKRRFIYKEQYYKKTSNVAQFILILLSFALMAVTMTYYYFPIRIVFIMLTFFEILNVVNMIIVTSFLFPTLKFSIYLKCFQKVFETYFNVFISFLPILIGFVALTFITFNDNLGESIASNFFHSVIIYSGVPVDEITKVTGFLQGVVMTLIVILMINKANLVLSIAVNDIHILMHQSKEFSLIHNARIYVDFAKKIRSFHAMTEFKENKNWRERLLLSLIRYCLQEYPYVHRLQDLYIDKITKNVYADIGKSIFERNNKRTFKCDYFGYKKLLNELFGNFKISIETMGKIEEIARIIFKKIKNSECK